MDVSKKKLLRKVAYRDCTTSATTHLSAGGPLKKSTTLCLLYKNFIIGMFFFAPTRGVFFVAIIKVFFCFYGITMREIECTVFHFFW